jgi:hypothetical protein
MKQEVHKRRNPQFTTQKKAFTKTWHCDLELPISRTVSSRFPLFISHSGYDICVRASLTYYVNVLLAFPT